MEFVRIRSAPETVSTFAALCDVPTVTVKNLVKQGIDDGVMILGKASGLGWPEIKEVLSVTMPHKVEYPEDEKALFEKFLTLSVANAQRVVRFLKVSKGVSKDDIKRML